MAVLPPDIAVLAEGEVDASIRWLWDHSESDAGLPGYGLVLDRDDRADSPCSVAATGFALATWVLGVERGLLDRDAVLARTRGTLRSLLGLPQRGGLLAHFVDATTGKRWERSEYSTIDTALALDGAIVAAQFFDDDECSALVEQLLERVDWAALVFTDDGERTLLRMTRVDAGDPEVYGEPDAAGFLGAWDMTAEQLTLYLLAAGHPDPNSPFAISEATARELWNGFARPVGTYAGHEVVYEWGGTLFVYHFPHAFWPFGVDDSGLNWWENSVSATAANAAWCAAQGRLPRPAFRSPAGSRTFAGGLWGTSACDGPWGYQVGGAEPARPPAPYYDGTISPASLVASLAFRPVEASAALRVLRDRHPGAWDSQYGLCDGVNLDPGNWYSKSRLGINKGQTALLGAAALGSTLVWELFNSHPWIRRGIQTIGLSPAIPLAAKGPPSSL
ncbi:MAG: hypothetical protein FWG25_00240 [Promicromonosporaceae bacterium]|nr:hypothetical protein [Promicromonosporaceae bacterium]